MHPIPDDNVSNVDVIYDGRSARGHAPIGATPSFNKIFFFSWQSWSAVPRCHAHPSFLHLSDNKRPTPGCLQRITRVKAARHGRRLLSFVFSRPTLASLRLLFKKSSFSSQQQQQQCHVEHCLITEVIQDRPLAEDDACRGLNLNTSTKSDLYLGTIVQI